MCIFVCECVCIFFSSPLFDTCRDSPVPVPVDNNPFSALMSQTGPTPGANTMYQLPCGQPSEQVASGADDGVKE